MLICSFQPHTPYDFGSSRRARLREKSFQKKFDAATTATAAAAVVATKHGMACRELIGGEEKTVEMREED